MTRKPIRPWAMVAFVLCLLGQVSNLGHLLFVQHVTCAMHGELIHAKSQGHNTIAFLLAAASVDSQQGYFLRQPFAGDDEHDHCVCLIERRKFLFAHATTEYTPPSAKLTVRRDGYQVPHSRAALHLLAPKTSPPA